MSRIFWLLLVSIGLPAFMLGDIQMKRVPGVKRPTHELKEWMDPDFHLTPEKEVAADGLNWEIQNEVIRVWHPDLQHPDFMDNRMIRFHFLESDQVFKSDGIELAIESVLFGTPSPGDFHDAE